MTYWPWVWKDGKKKINVLEAIDIEMMRQGILEKDKEYFEWQVESWNKEPVSKLMSLIYTLHGFMPRLDEKGLNAEKLKIYLKSIKSKFVRERLCWWACSYTDVLDDEGFLKEREKLQKFSKEHNLP